MTKTAKPAPLVTRESLRAMIIDQPHDKVQHVIGRALVALFNRQTESERQSDGTTDANSIGFAGADAKGGSLTAKSYLARKMLVEWQVEKWTRLSSNGFPRICKYHRQLNEIAEEKRDRERAQAQAGTHVELERLRYELGMVLDSDDEKMIDMATRPLHALERRLGLR